MPKLIDREKTEVRNRWMRSNKETINLQKPALLSRVGALDNQIDGLLASASRMGLSNTQLLLLLKETVDRRFELEVS